MQNSIDTMQKTKICKNKEKQTHKTENKENKKRNKQENKNAKYTMNKIYTNIQQS